MPNFYHIKTRTESDEFVVVEARRLHKGRQTLFIGPNSLQIDVQGNKLTVDVLNSRGPLQDITVGGLDPNENNLAELKRQRISSITTVTGELDDPLIKYYGDIAEFVEVRDELPKIGTSIH